MAIYPNIYQTLVPCPIVELRGYLAACGLKGRLYAYLDYNGPTGCLLYTSDAADEIYGVYLGGRRIIKKIFFKS